MVVLPPRRSCGGGVGGGDHDDDDADDDDADDDDDDDDDDEGEGDDGVCHTSHVIYSKSKATRHMSHVKRHTYSSLEPSLFAPRLQAALKLQRQCYLPTTSQTKIPKPQTPNPKPKPQTPNLQTQRSTR